MEERPVINEKAKIEAKLERLASEFVEGYMTKEFYRKNYFKISEQLAKIKPVEIKPKLSVEDIPTAEIYLQNDITGKRQVLSLFIDRIELESLKKTGCRKPEKRVKVIWNDIIS